MFDGVLAWLYSPVPKIYLLLLAWVLWRMMRYIDKHIATVEAAKAKVDSDAWWAKKEDEPQEYGQVYRLSVRKEWDRRAKSLDEDECYWRAVPAGGILYETTLVPVSAEQSDKLNEIPATDRLHGWIAAAPPAEKKRRWGLRALSASRRSV